MADETQQPEAGGTADAKPRRRKTDRPQGATTKNLAKKRGESRHSQRRIEAVETQAKALEYRKLGLSYSQIAQKLELNSPQTAWNAVESALKRTLQDDADAVRKLEAERLDAMFLPVYSNAMRGDLQALSACLNIMTRRARLLGLDAPERKELTGKDGKPLELTPTTIVIGGPGEEGEPAVMGDSLVPTAAE